MASAESSSHAGQATASATGGLFEKFEKALEDIRGLVACKICTKPMHEPYVTECGHSFCYNCLSQWLVSHRHNKTCPGCRAQVTKEPVPDFTVRDMVHLLTSRAELVEAGETTDTHRVDREEEAGNIETDKTNQDPRHGGLFKGCFRRPARPPPLYDPTDGVERCPDCHWELEHARCLHCDRDWAAEDLGADLQELEDSLNSDSHFDDDEDDDDGSDSSHESDISLDGEGNSVHARENSLNGDYTIRALANNDRYDPHAALHYYHQQMHQQALGNHAPMLGHHPPHGPQHPQIAHPMANPPMRYNPSEGRSSPTATVDSEDEHYESLGSDGSDDGDDESDEDSGSDLESFIDDEVEPFSDYPATDEEQGTSPMDAIPVSDDESALHPDHFGAPADPFDHDNAHAADAVIEISSDDNAGAPARGHRTYRFAIDRLADAADDDEEDGMGDGSATVTSLGRGSSRNSRPSSRTTDSSASNGSGSSRSRDASAANLHDRRGSRKRRRVVLDDSDDDDEADLGGAGGPSGSGSGGSEASVVLGGASALARRFHEANSRRRQRARRVVDSDDEEDDAGAHWNVEADGDGDAGSSALAPTVNARPPANWTSRRAANANTGSRIARRRRRPQTSASVPTYA